MRRVRARLRLLRRRFGRNSTVRLVGAVLGGVSAAGGGLLAAGLAFQALFAILPALLLLAGISGWLVEDPSVRIAIVTELLRAVPPLAAPVGETLQRLVENRGAFSLIGVIGLLWGASNLYGALDEAIARLIPGERERNVFERRLRGVAAVLLVLAASIGAVLAGAGMAFVRDSFPVSGRWAGPLSQLAGFLVTGVILVLALLFIYRTMPTAPPSLRAALLPAIGAGLAIALLTDLYSLVAPRLIGALEAFGVLAALFGALIWLGYVCQVLMFGAAWARVRRDLEATASQR
jgi:membrane protein